MWARSVSAIVAATVILTGLLHGDAALADAREDAATALHALFARERIIYYRENPGTAPVGAPRPVPDRWRGVAPEDHSRRSDQAGIFLDDLNAIDRSALGDEDRLNHDMFRYYLERELLFARYRTWRIPFFSDSGFHTYPSRAWTQYNFTSVGDYERYIALLTALPAYFEAHIANLETGMAERFTMPRVVMEGLLPTFGAYVTDDPAESPFYGPFVRMADTIDPAESKRLQTTAQAAIANHVVPAYARLDRFIREEYMPAVRTALDATGLPGGKSYYAAMVRFYTTLDITPEEVHAKGLSEVERIRREMEAVIADAGFDGGLQAFIAFLRSDPQFYAKSERDLLLTASYLAKKIDGVMPAFFGRLPRQPYGVEAVPAAIAPNYTTGRYVGAPLDAPRGGMYWVNTYALDKRPLYTLPALTLHEAVPGHHHQIALSKELENVPEFRLGLYPHAFGEGWGLYAEKLGIEMGLYETPYDHFGRLSYEMWRACRLVIDTGIHAFGWTRERAIALLEENSALSTHNIRTEVDRYISWPGQALAYKMGELKILELRRRAQKVLGARFDIRAFHDEILSVGGVPLGLLEDRIDLWIEAQTGEDGAG
ncbi:DUF885 domain-containing protein [Eilatimonas milleporae]|uniref:Uncharacterized protein (DUF885 family) n=1 Tax=Eilatimonas milleporae TaxID=911205 RepID=A0A3M0CNJ1_9PROT|nr:DUF885 domain-containing protein [Eilatimonas milleporae]RMB08459.1 uncharacterized protein (DUF885 family) [Eilatimonas milleporae]